MAEFQSYIICTSPRSGSTLLCQLLRSSGVAGDPISPFNNASVLEWGRENGVVAPDADVMRAALEAAMRKARGQTDVAGMRLQMHSFRYFIEDLRALRPDAPSDCARAEMAFGRILWIFLTRSDKVAQAVSYVKAEQSGLWHATPDGREIERLSPPAEPAYDHDRIGRQVETFRGYERAWRDWFRAEGIAPVEISYDALSRDPVGTLRTMLVALGADESRADGVEIGVGKLADAVSADWIARYRAASGGA